MFGKKYLSFLGFILWNNRYSYSYAEKVEGEYYLSEYDNTLGQWVDITEVGKSGILHLYESNILYNTESIPGYYVSGDNFIKCDANKHCILINVPDETECTSENVGSLAFINGQTSICLNFNDNINTSISFKEKQSSSPQEKRNFEEITYLVKQNSNSDIFNFDISVNYYALKVMENSITFNYNYECADKCINTDTGKIIDCNDTFCSSAGATCDLKVTCTHGKCISKKNNKIEDTEASININKCAFNLNNGKYSIANDKECPNGYYLVDENAALIQKIGVTGILLQVKKQIVTAAPIEVGYFKTSDPSKPYNYIIECSGTPTVTCKFMNPRTVKYCDCTGLHDNFYHVSYEAVYSTDYHSSITYEFEDQHGSIVGYSGNIFGTDSSKKHLIEITDNSITLCKTLEQEIHIDEPDVVLDEKGVYWKIFGKDSTCNFIENEGMECIISKAWGTFEFKTSNNYNGGTFLVTMKAETKTDFYFNTNFPDIGYSRGYSCTTEYDDYLFKIPTNPTYTSNRYAIQSYRNGNTYYIKKIVYYPSYIPIPKECFISCDDVTANNIPFDYCSDYGSKRVVTSLTINSKSLSKKQLRYIFGIKSLESLDLRYNKMKEIPPEIGNLTKLKSLYIYGNEITKIPPEIGNLSNLENLYLDSNKLTEIPSDIGKLSNLRFLDLSYNMFESFPSEVGSISNLETLYLFSNQITNISGIGNLKNLKNLDLRNNQIKEVPSEFENLKNLKILNLSNNQLTRIPSIIEKISNLNDLDLSYNQITEIPSEIGKLLELERLELNNNQITTIPTEIGNLSNLNYLSLSGDNKQSFPQVILNIKNLNTLSLSNYYITDIPSEIKNHLNLYSLVLKKNQITSIPSTVYEIPNLNFLDLSYNQITDISSDIKKISNLNNLNLSYNQIKSIPSEIGDLLNLQDLNLNNNQIEGIPSIIKNLSNLRNLYLSDNKITEIPSEIGDVNNLYRLELSRNKITTIPNEITKLSYLHYLYLSSNEIKDIPSEIGNLSNLLTLDLSDNQIATVPSTIKNTALTSLFLNNNKFTNFPLEILYITTLYSLNLNNNQIKEIPSEIGNLSHLLNLNLSNNQIKKIPLEIENLPSLNFLSLFGNQIKEIPSVIKNLSNLYYLDITDNCIECNDKPKLEISNYQCYFDDIDQDKCKWKSCENETGLGHYLENFDLKYYDGTNSYTYNNPLPGFYMSKCDSNKYIQCSNKLCTSKSLPEDEQECDSTVDGKLIKTNSGFSLCTKINKWNSQNDINSENYISIPFSNTENENDKYLIHHKGEIFNFDRTITITNYVVSKNLTTIVFDPLIKDFKDQCALTSGIIVDRLNDFCSSDSSGMYYTCTLGKCTSEYQTSIGQFEKIDESSCSCYKGNAASTCSIKDVGYYYDNDTQYFYSDISTSCIPVNPENAVIGFYWNGYQYNKISKFNGEIFSSVTLEVVTSNYCEGRRNEIVDTGFNLVFCNGDGDEIFIHNITKDEIIFTKGVSNTLFSEINIYYALKKNKNVLALDESINGSVIYDEIEYICDEGLCTLNNNNNQCIPESINKDDRVGCSNGYYLVSDHLYYCNKRECEVQNLIGYFSYAVSNDYIKCTSDGTKITCSKLNAPTKNDNKCTKAGDLLYIDGKKIKLCLDTTVENAIEIFKKDTANYFMQGNILNTSLSNNKYYIIDVIENAVITSTDQDNKPYKYTFKNFKIITLKNQCTTTAGQTANDLIEYTRETASNTYIKE